VTTQQPFKIGSAFALASNLLARDWRKLLWLYGVLLLVPHVLLGELSDHEGELLFGLFNGRFGGEADTLPNLIGYVWDIPTAVFYAAALATMLKPNVPPWHGTARALPTTLLALVLPTALFAAFAVLPAMLLKGTTTPSAWMFITLQIATYALYVVYFIMAILLFVACAAATTQFSVVHAIRRSIMLVKPFWFRILVLALFIGICEIASNYGEQVLLRNYETPDATLMDWITTCLQEVLRGGYRIVAAALEVAAFVLLVTYRDGPPPAETAAVFD
jgi:hypothetical protein